MVIKNKHVELNHVRVVIKASRVSQCTNVIKPMLTKIKEPSESISVLKPFLLKRKARVGKDWMGSQ